MTIARYFREIDLNRANPCEDSERLVSMQTALGTDDGAEWALDWLQQWFEREGRIIKVESFAQSSLVDMGFDSLDLIVLVTEFENEFGVEVLELTPDSLHTVGDLAGNLARNAKR